MQILSKNINLLISSTSKLVEMAIVATLALERLDLLGCEVSLSLDSDFFLVFFADSFVEPFLFPLDLTGGDFEFWDFARLSIF